jgi:hypothetical protein
MEVEFEEDYILYNNLFEYNKLLREIIHNINNLNLVIKEINSPKDINDSLIQYSIIKNIEVKIQDINNILSKLKTNFNTIDDNDFIGIVEDKLNFIVNQIIKHKLALSLMDIILSVKECHKQSIDNIIIEH